MSEFVSIPVPVERVQEVYELLARKSAGSGARVETSPDLPAGWDHTGIQTFYAESGAMPREFLHYLAARPDLEVPATEIGKHLNASGSMMGGMLSSLHRRSINRYGKEWPVIRYERGDQQVFYRMTKAVAEVIQACERDAAE